MAGYRPYGYQYETSPRKLQPEYDYPRTNYKKKKSTSVKKGKAKQTAKKTVRKQSKRKLKYNVKPVLYKDGIWYADYKRLRIIAEKII